jgi:DNA-directed RNA polymerase specialized sigma24 family protein
MTTMLNVSPSKLLNPATDGLKPISLSQQGDAEEFARLYACYVGRITRYVYFRVTDHELAEDMPSRIFLKVLEKLDLQIKSQQLRAALQVLTDEQQRVSILKFIDGLTTREIARQLGKRQGAVRGLQTRALQRLSRCPSLQREQFYGQ